MRVDSQALAELRACSDLAELPEPLLEAMAACSAVETVPAAHVLYLATEPSEDHDLSLPARLVDLAKRVSRWGDRLSQGGRDLLPSRGLYIVVRGDVNLVHNEPGKLLQRALGPGSLLGEEFLTGSLESGKSLAQEWGDPREFLPHWPRWSAETSRQSVIRYLDMEALGRVKSAVSAEHWGALAERIRSCYAVNSNAVLVRQAMREHPDLRAAQQRYFDAMLEGAVYLEVEEEQLLIEQGKPSPGLWVLVEGSCRATQNAAQLGFAEPLDFGRLAPGETFGLHEFIRDQHMPLHITAAAGSKLVLVPRQRLDELLRVRGFRVSIPYLRNQPMTPTNRGTRRHIERLLVMSEGLGAEVEGHLVLQLGVALTEHLNEAVFHRMVCATPGEDTIATTASACVQDVTRHLEGISSHRPGIVLVRSRDREWSQVMVQAGVFDKVLWVSRTASSRDVPPPGWLVRAPVNVETAMVLDANRLPTPGADRHYKARLLGIVARSLMPADRNGPIEPSELLERGTVRLVLPEDASGWSDPSVRVKRTVERLARAVCGARVGLALGGGGALGFAHIAFIEQLEEAGVPIDMVSGASMGAIVGAYYAHAPDDGLEVLQERGLAWTAVVFSAFFDSHPVSWLIDADLQSRMLAELEIPFFAAVTDADSGLLDYLRGGSTGRAVRGSGSMPPMGPTTIGNRRFLDGGVAALVPTSVLEEEGADLILSSNCISLPAFRDRARESYFTWMGRSATELDPLKRLNDLYRTVFMMMKYLGDATTTDAYVHHEAMTEGLGAAEFWKVKEVAEIAGNSDELRRAVADARKRWLERLRSPVQRVEEYGSHAVYPVLPAELRLDVPLPFETDREQLTPEGEALIGHVATWLGHRSEVTGVAVVPPDSPEGLDDGDLAREQQAALRERRGAAIAAVLRGAKPQLTVRVAIETPAARGRARFVLTSVDAYQIDPEKTSRYLERAARNQALIANARDLLESQPTHALRTLVQVEGTPPSDWMNTAFIAWNYGCRTWRTIPADLESNEAGGLLDSGKTVWYIEQSVDLGLGHTAGELHVQRLDGEQPREVFRFKPTHRWTVHTFTPAFAVMVGLGDVVGVLDPRDPVQAGWTDPHNINPVRPMILLGVKHDDSCRYGIVARTAVASGPFGVRVFDLPSSNVVSVAGRVLREEPADYLGHTESVALLSVDGDVQLVPLDGGAVIQRQLADGWRPSLLHPSGEAVLLERRTASGGFELAMWWPGADASDERLLEIALLVRAPQAPVVFSPDGRFLLCPNSLEAGSQAAPLSIVWLEHQSMLRPRTVRWTGSHLQTGNMLSIEEIVLDDHGDSVAVTVRHARSRTGWIEVLLRHENDFLLLDALPIYQYDRPRVTIQLAHMDDYLEVLSFEAHYRHELAREGQMRALSLFTLDLRNRARVLEVGGILEVAECRELEVRATDGWVVMERDGLEVCAYSPVGATWRFSPWFTPGSGSVLAQLAAALQLPETVIDVQAVEQTSGATLALCSGSLFRITADAVSQVPLPGEVRALSSCGGVVAVAEGDEVALHWLDGSRREVLDGVELTHRLYIGPGAAMLVHQDYDDAVHRVGVCLPDGMGWSAAEEMRRVEQVSFLGDRAFEMWSRGRDYEVREFCADGVRVRAKDSIKMPVQQATLQLGLDGDFLAYLGLVDGVILELTAQTTVEHRGHSGPVQHLAQTRGSDWMMSVSTKTVCRWTAAPLRDRIELPAPVGSGAQISAASCSRDGCLVALQLLRGDVFYVSLREAFLDPQHLLEAIAERPLYEIPDAHKQ